MSLNVAECLELSAVACPDKTAVVCDDTRMTYGELESAAKRVANLLRDKGIGRGDRVAMMIPNTPHFPIIYYGILYAGATVVPFNVLFRRREILYRLNDVGARAFLAWQDTAQQATVAFHEAETCEHLIVVEPTLRPQKPEVGESFVQLLMAASDDGGMAQTQPEETAVIFYTAAMAGAPMGAELTHFNLFQNALTSKEFSLKYYPEDVCLAALPLFHAFGQTTMLNAPFLAQSTVVLAPRFEAHRIFETIAQENVTLLTMVPAMFHLLLASKREEIHDLSSLRWITAGGSKMPVELAHEFSERFGVPVLEGYGLTETSPVVSFNHIETNRPGSVGRPIWGCRVRIKQEDGSFAGPNEIGEIVIRGHNVMKGYLHKPKATAEALAGGWMHTGDLGYLDEDGFIFITGHSKEIILRAGMNVYPREIEVFLGEHPAIADAAILGMPDPVRGEEVKAFIVFKQGMHLSHRDLRAYCREQLASYKCPRSFEVIDALPVDRKGRVMKEILRERNP